MLDFNNKEIKRRLIIRKFFLNIVLLVSFLTLSSLNKSEFKLILK